MDSSTLEALILPWWKLPIYLLAITLSIVTIRVSIRFDINSWLQERRKLRERKQRLKFVEQCQHLWTLYTASPHSRCNRCNALIATTTVQAELELSHDKPLIAGVSNNLIANSNEGDILVSNSIGARM